MKTTSLKNLTHAALLHETQTLVSEERKITLALLEHLLEIDSRMLYAELGYASLFEFSVKHLGLSEGSAHRRISAMHLMREVPDVKAQLQSGSLSLSNAAQAQVIFRKEKKLKKVRRSILDKKEVLARLQNKTQKEAQNIFLELAPEIAVPNEQVRALTPEKTELKLVLSQELLDKLNYLKAQLAHALPPQASYAELVEKLVCEKIESLDKKRGKLTGVKTSHIESPRLQNPAAGQIKTNHSSAQPGNTLSPKPRGAKYVPLLLKRTHIPLPLQRTIRHRATHRCEYICPKTHRRCASIYKLEIDHVEPVSRGGDNTPENLQLLCRTHNVHQARKKLGIRVIERFRSV